MSFGMCVVLAVAFLVVFRPTLFAFLASGSASKRQPDPDRYMKAMRGIRY